MTRKGHTMKPSFHRAQRAREMRDIYTKLRRTYVVPVVEEFFLRNYFIGQSQLYKVMRLADKEPVDTTRASMTYITVMSDSFKL